MDRRWNGDRFILYVNPGKIEEKIRDRRWTAYKAWDVVIHELAHIWSIIEDGNTSHNESYNEKAHRVRDLVWDQREMHTLFTQCWNLVK
jgi:predicted metallopeptidase